MTVARTVCIVKAIMTASSDSEVRTSKEPSVFSERPRKNLQIYPKSFVFCIVKAIVPASSDSEVRIPDKRRISSPESSKRDLYFIERALYSVKRDLYSGKCQGHHGRFIWFWGPHI